MSLDLDKIECKLIDQAAHGFAISDMPYPTYVSDSGLIELANADDIQREAFGLSFIENANQINYCTSDTIIEVDSHGFNVGDILYLQDDGTLDETPGTFIQKIFEVIDEDCLNYLKQPMNGSESSASSIAKVEIISQAINNVGAAQNDIQFGASVIDGIGLTIAGNQITLPDNAIYRTYMLLNFFDNNSARVAHRVTPVYEGIAQTPVEGENYMRDASAHDNASIDFSDLFATSGSNIINYQIQSHSSLLNTTDLTSGYLIIEKK